MPPIQSISTQPAEEPSEFCPMVYFRGVNRIQKNRFKAYLQILSNRLTTQWVITEDVKQANVVIQIQAHSEAKQTEFELLVFSDFANLNPPQLWQTELNFDEVFLIKKLNQASRHLMKGFQGENRDQNKDRTIKVCGLLDESLSQLCDALNAHGQNLHFEPCMRVFSSHNDLYRDQMLLMLDPQLPKSMQAYQNLIEKKAQGHIVIDALTIAIIQDPDHPTNEDIFDWVYGHIDGSTHVTLLNPRDPQELSSFVKYL